MMQTNIRSGKYLNIFEYPNIRHTMLSIIITIIWGSLVGVTMTMQTGDFYRRRHAADSASAAFICNSASIH